MAPTTSSFGHGPSMIVFRGRPRPHEERRAEKNLNKEQSGPNNRFGSVMLEEPRNIQDSNQVFSHKSQQGDRAANKCATVPSKKRKMEKGPRNVASNIYSIDEWACPSYHFTATTKQPYSKPLI